MTLQDLVIQAAIKELQTPTSGVTEQYLEIYDIVRVNGVPQVARVDMEGNEDIAIVYLPIKGESFYLAIYVNTQPQIAIRNVGTENNNKVYFRAASETLSYSELTTLTRLKASEGWSNGDYKKNGKARYTYSCAKFEPNPEPDAFEDKLGKLLDYLEQDIEGVTKLVDQADAYIQVDVDIHNGNGLIGGPYISKQNIKRMSDLNLEISFSQFVTGNPFK